ncbi:MAG: hypothetical protein OXC81_03765, partial [Betaproteobacteria bacterium]|nr:hypothetical protein [Betaproteobacteria bacterium]
MSKKKTWHKFAAKKADAPKPAGRPGGGQRRSWLDSQGKLIHGDAAAALADFDALIANPSASSDTALHLCERGLLRVQTGNRSGGSADLDRAIEMAPERGLLWSCRAQVKATFGDFAGALADCDAAVSRQPDNGEFIYQRISFRFKTGNFAAAMEDANNLVERQPDDARFRVAR